MRHFDIWSAVLLTASKQASKFIKRTSAHGRKAHASHVGQEMARSNFGLCTLQPNDDRQTVQPEDAVFVMSLAEQAAHCSRTECLLPHSRQPVNILEPFFQHSLIR